MLSFIKPNEQKSVREPEALLLIHGLCSSLQELRPLITRIEAAGFEVHARLRLIHSVKRNLSKIVAPTLIMHAREDDVSRLRSADLVCSRISSHELVKCVFDNSYHMLTLDNDRNAIAQAAVDFLSGSRRRVSAWTALPADANRGGRRFA